MSTPLLGLYAPSTGSDAGTWGTSWNDQGSTYIDNLIAGISTIALSSSNVLLTAAQARTQMLRFTGTLLASVDISPDAGVLWNGIRCVENMTTGNFTITLTNAGGSVVLPAGRRGLVYLDTSNGPRFICLSSTTSADTIPAGYPMPFYSAAAPTGWTQNTSLNDYALRIVNSTGAGTGGSVNFSTLFARTSTDSYTLQTADIPSHSHGVTGGTKGSANTVGVQDGGSFTGLYTAATITISNTGGGGGHSHGMDMRVKYADFIIAAH